MTDSIQRYGRVAIGLHWIIAACVLGVIGLGLTVERLDMGGIKDTLLSLHKSLGLLIFGLTILRLGWRLTHPVPALPNTVPKPQRYAAWFTHFLLYAVTFAMPVSGYISVAARARETSFFWLFDVPQWVPLDRGLSRTAEMLHTNGQYIVYALLVGHIGAALYHHMLLKDGVLERMWPSHRKSSAPTTD